MGDTGGRGVFSDYLQVVMTTQNGPDVERRTRECVPRADFFPYIPPPTPPWLNRP